MTDYTTFRAAVSDGISIEFPDSTVDISLGEDRYGNPVVTAVYDADSTSLSQHNVNIEAVGDGDSFGDLSGATVLVDTHSSGKSLLVVLE